MRVSNRFLAVAYAAVFLTLQTGCGGGGTDANAPPDDNAGRAQGESLDSVETRWKRANKDKPTGITASFDISGKSLYLKTSGKAQIDSPGALVPAPLFPDNQRCVFFADAQVNGQTGLLVLEGTQLQFTAGTLGAVDVGSAVANTQAPSGSTTPVVALTTEDHLSATAKPTVTFPADWTGTDKSLFFSQGALVHASNLTVTGFTRGLLITPSGNTPITGSVTVTAATQMFWDSKSVIQAATATVHSPTFALGGEVETGAITSTELQAASTPPSMIKGHDADVVLHPGSAKSQGSFQLTQAVSQEGGMILQPDLEVAYDTTPVTVKKDQRTLIPVVFREKGLKADAVISELQVTGSGKDAVSVPLDHVDSTLEQLWKTVGDTGIDAPFLAVALVPASPFIALGDLLNCAFSTCPQAYPIWMNAGTANRFHIIVQGKLPAGTYDATVTLTGRNFATVQIPVQFTVTE